MKRKFLYAAILLTAIVGLAQADYIIIIANVSLPREKDPADPQDPNNPPAVVRPGGKLGGNLVPAPAPQPAAGKNDSMLQVTAVLEVSRLMEIPIDQNTKFYQITHRWGSSYFQPTDTIKLVRWVTPENRPMPGITARFQQRLTDLFKVPKPSTDKILELAEWALGHGMIKECADLMKKAGELDKDHPSVVAFRQVEADLARPMEKEDVASVWQKKLLENYRAVRSAHYVLLHNATSDDSPVVQSRLARLEDTYRGFYYWFALKRKRLPVPNQRLVVVLVTREGDFTHQHRIFDNPPLVADGFFARRDNLAVFSATSQDVAYHALREGSKDLWNTFSRDLILAGKAKMPIPMKEEDIPIIQQQFLDANTKALFLKALENDSERATVTHDGTRQLVSAAGLLPRTLEAPEWIQFGMGSFFETAKGSPWGGVGVPSPTLYDDYNYLFQYKKMAEKNRKLDKTDLLQGVVTDRFFREALGKKDGHTELKARTTAWALTFFLAHKKLDDLLAYYKELAKMPRDLEFDDEALLNCFARAFRLVDDKGNRSPSKLTAFAIEWHEYINLAPLEAEEMLKQIHKNQAELRGGP